MVRLVPMTEQELTDYLVEAVRDYARDKVAAGNWEAEESLEQSAQEYARLLPKGVASPDNYLFTIEDEEGAKVGMIWFARPAWATRSTAFIFDFRIAAPFRRRGYATQALAAVEEEVRALGLDTISLHVFAHNRGAISLYEKVGYLPTNINMSKSLGSQEP